MYPRIGDRRRGQADPEPAGEGSGQSGRRVPSRGELATASSRPLGFHLRLRPGGKIRSQVDDEPARVYLPGESCSETPGAHHRVSENASDTEPARLLAVLIVDATDKQLVIPDPE